MGGRGSGSRTYYIKQKKISVNLKTTVESIQSDEQKGKKNEDSLRHLWYPIKETHLCIMGVSEEEPKIGRKLNQRNKN